MAGKYIIGIDVGTQSIKAHLYNQDGSFLEGGAIAQYIETLKPMWATQKADFWWKSVVSLLQEIVKKSGVNPRDIVSVGCCAHMHGVVALDKEGNVLMNDVQLYCDKRAADIAQSLLSKDIDRVYDLTANMPTSNWFGIKVKWIQENEPEIYEKAVKFLTPKDYINFKLTGEYCIDPSEAAGSFLMDRHTLEWSDYLIANLGVHKEKLPRIEKACDIVGNISQKAAKETGLSTGTAVSCGAGDMMCSLFTSGLTTPGSVVDSTGTGSTICYYAKQPIMDRRIMNLYYIADGFVPFGNIDSSGGAFRWLRDNLGKQETLEARKKGIDEYVLLCQLAKETTPGAEGLLFLPYLMGERTMGTANSRGCFIGMNLSTQIGHLVRAVLEGVAFEHKRTLDVFESTGNTVTQIYHTAGGAKGDLWNQIKADIYGKPVYTLKADEGGVLGAALTGAIATRLYENTQQASDLVLKTDREYLPNPSNAARYQEMYSVFCQLHDGLQGPFADLARASQVQIG